MARPRRACLNAALRTTETRSIELPITPSDAEALARAIGQARGLRPGQLPTGAQFAEGLNGLEECAAFIDSVGQPHAPFPLPRYVPVPVVEPAPEHGR
jgi:hypothetical protein